MTHDDDDRVLEMRDIALAVALGTAAWMVMLWGVLAVVESFL